MKHTIHDPEPNCESEENGFIEAALLGLGVVLGLAITLTIYWGISK